MYEEHTFLFASLGSKQPCTSRKVHIRRLYDILQLCIHRQDFERAKRAWAVLARCKEFDWKSMWSTGLLLLGGIASRDSYKQELDYLRSMMLQQPDDRETILKELVFRLLLAGKSREALDELELYLPSFPYQDNPEFHIYAGLSTLYLAHNPSGHSNPAMMREAEIHFDHAKVLDPENTVAQAFLDKIKDLRNVRKIVQDDSDDDERMSPDAPSRDTKRSRI